MLVHVCHLMLVSTKYINISNKNKLQIMIIDSFAMKADAKRADQNALLVLRNMRPLGFKNGDRFQGFDKNTAFKILEVN